MKRTIITLLLCILTLCVAAKTQEDSHSKGWYVGIGAGVPFSVSSFSSFATGGPFWGWTSGISAGYRFNSLLGLEADLGLGQTNLAAQQGCLESNYYLGADGKLYYASVLGMDSWSVKDFKSAASYYRIGLRVNFNLLSFMPTGSRWTLDLSPRIAACCTKEKMISLSGKEVLNTDGGKSRMHFGYGASVKAAFRLSDHFRLGLESGLTALTGKGLDGIPDHGHKTNLIWETALQLTYDIWSDSGKDRKNPKENRFDDIDEAISQSQADIRPRIVLHSANNFEIAPPALPKARPLAEIAHHKPVPESRSVHFALDKWNITASEAEKLNEILDAMRNDDSLHLNLEGWCDQYGTDEVNMVISSLRAESVKQWFIVNGIDSARIEASGMGIDKLESNRENARRVDVRVCQVME